MMEAAQLEQLSDCSADIPDEELKGSDGFFDSEHYADSYKLGQNVLEKGEGKGKKIVFKS